MESDSLPTTHSVLFVGNSLTFWNGGVDRHVRGLGGSLGSPLIVETDVFVEPGATLAVLWDQGASEAIAQGDHDVVVVQEDLPEGSVEQFDEHARLLIEQIRRADAEPVLFMAWAYDRLDWITTEEIADAHRVVSAELGVKVAPVGLAWQAAVAERPELAMYDTDAEHPSMHGTYLAAATILATIYGQDLRDATYLPDGVTEDEGAFLRLIAWETVNEYSAN